MWKASAGQSVTVAVDEGGDDWETDPDFEVRHTTPSLRLGPRGTSGLLRGLTGSLGQTRIHRD